MTSHVAMSGGLQLWRSSNKDRESQGESEQLMDEEEHPWERQKEEADRVTAAPASVGYEFFYGSLGHTCVLLPYMKGWRMCNACLGRLA